MYITKKRQPKDKNTMNLSKMKTQVFKGRKLTRTKVKNNILRIWKQADEGDKYDWYKEAHEYAQILTEKIRGINGLSKSCGLIAALSPVKTWKDNKKVALDMIMTGDCGHIGQFKDKAINILKSDGTDESILSILRGNKISSFYHNIRYPQTSDKLTIDRHALSIALGEWIKDEDYRGMTKQQYDFFVTCYNLASEKVNVTPLLMQSATWVKWRKIKSDYR